MEYLHLQLISLVTNASLLELKLRPNLDLKTSIYLERTLDMMCEVSQSSPAKYEFNLNLFRFGMLVTKLNVISIFADLYD